MTYTAESNLDDEEVESAAAAVREEAGIADGGRGEKVCDDELDDKAVIDKKKKKVKQLILLPIRLFEKLLNENKERRNRRKSLMRPPIPFPYAYDDPAVASGCFFRSPPPIPDDLPFGPNPNRTTKPSRAYYHGFMKSMLEKNDFYSRESIVVHRDIRPPKWRPEDTPSDGKGQYTSTVLVKKQQRKFSSALEKTLHLKFLRFMKYILEYCAFIKPSEQGSFLLPRKDTAASGSASDSLQIFKDSERCHIWFCTDLSTRGEFRLTAPTYHKPPTPVHKANSQPFGLFVQSPNDCDAALSIAVSVAITAVVLRAVLSRAAFDLFHLLGSDLEGPGEDVVGHRRGSCEERNGDGLGARKLAVEGGDDGGRSGTVVLLEVNEPPGKYEHLALGNGLGYQLVGSGDEADVEGAVEDEDDLGGTRVGVGRVQPAGGVVNPG
ncbi:hypothetical protein MUK42_37700 [Musa troglodytarum]|uniref:Uncharacterized protein n=1 Tax=Musa troglodytarum TaxID=320322 RepID=A0A9E7JKB2_9LILI|nr:hypothetical protein MUK42_37700 [Musa troglodytarum]